MISASGDAGASTDSSSAGTGQASVGTTTCTPGSTDTTADSTLTTLSGAVIADGAITNILGSGHTVYSDASSSAELNGATHSLSGGGTLTPLE